MAKGGFTVICGPANGYKKDQGPYIKFGGGWPKDFGISVGDKLEVIQGRNMIVLMKVSKEC